MDQGPPLLQAVSAHALCASHRARKRPADDVGHTAVT
jgi:hypothetical protein